MIDQANVQKKLAAMSMTTVTYSVEIHVLIGEVQIRVVEEEETDTRQEHGMFA